jgi:hypothetical protein
MISEVPSSSQVKIDVHNIDERNFSINYLFNMTTWRF